MLIGAGLGHWSTVELLYVVFAIAVGGFVRGYSGFGFALAAAPMLSVVLDPVDAIPLVLAFEVILTLAFLPRLVSLVDWRALRWLVLGAVMGTPFGIYFIAAVPPEPMRFILGLILLVSVLVTWRRPSSQRWRPTSPATAGVGAISGVLSGGTAMSGPPIVLYFLAVPVSPAVGRASMMMFFLCSATIALLFGVSAGVYPTKTFVLAGLSLPALLAGAILGAKLFAYSEPTTYRQVALSMLGTIAVFALGSATFHALGMPRM